MTTMRETTISLNSFKNIDLNNNDHIMSIDRMKTAVKKVYIEEILPTYIDSSSKAGVQYVRIYTLSTHLFHWMLSYTFESDVSYKDVSPYYDTIHRGAQMAAYLLQEHFQLLKIPHDDDHLMFSDYYLFIHLSRRSHQTLHPDASVAVDEE
jgi:hypothetical protein